MIMNKGIVIPLTMLIPWRDAVVVDIIGGEGIRRRLTELGFSKGSIIKILKKDNGPMIVTLGESRMVLGFGMAQKIMVEEV